VGKMRARSAGIDASTSARDGRFAPVCRKKCASKGSSTTPKSGRCAKLYIKAVLQLRGPDQRETVIVFYRTTETLPVYVRGTIS